MNQTNEVNNTPNNKKNPKENKPNNQNIQNNQKPGGFNKFNKNNKKRNKNNQNLQNNSNNQNIQGSQNAQKRNDFNSGHENKNTAHQPAKTAFSVAPNNVKKNFKNNNSNKAAEIENDFDASMLEGDDIPAQDYLSAIAPEVETGPKIEIVGVRFKSVGKIYFFAPGKTQFSPNDKIIVETSRGLELGYIVIPNKNISESKVVQPLKQVLRRASEEDVEKSERNKKLAKETMKIANDRIKFHNLNSMKMKLIEAEYTFDNSKLIYYFTAEGRVDFRELVKDLAAIFKTRIEMRQIGIRDQTKILGGLSICGRPFCCSSFLQDFAQVTIKMAKEQNMPINSAKMSGACGRLMCCLKYEHEAYDFLNKDTPKVNAIVETSTGETGTVIDSNVLTGICKVRITQKNPAETGDAVKPIHKKNLKTIGFMKNDQEHLYGKNEETEDI